MSSAPNYVHLFNENIRLFFTDALHIALKDPARALFLFQTLQRQKRATQVRQEWEARGVHVPPFMIASITRRCNLKCKGCYARVQHRPEEAEMSADKLRSVIAEARDLGVSIMMLAGGEPLTRPEILDIAADFPEIIFPLFTNGLLLNDEMIARLRTYKNIVPVISLEGHAAETNDRRGQGVYEHLLGAMRQMHDSGVFFGASMTVTSLNFGAVMARSFAEELMAVGCKLFFYIEYVPVQEGTEVLVLSDEQRALEAEILETLRKELPALFVAFPGDEEVYGGCLAAGRGFVHISPDGRLEPCPFSPYSDISLKEVSLQEALRSRFLRTIRESDEQLSETRGGCALWEKREWVNSLLQSR